MPRLQNNLYVINVANLGIHFLWNTSIQSYYISFFHRLSVVSNNIMGEGLVALSESLKTNDTLSHIYIWGNKFDEATCVVSFFFFTEDIF